MLRGAAIPDRAQERCSIGTLSMSVPIQSGVGPGGKLLIEIGRALMSLYQV